MVKSFPATFVITSVPSRAADLVPLAEAMGPEIWGWQHARRLTSQAPWRARPHVDERRERLAVAYAMTADIDTWERALALHDGLIERARRLRDSPRRSAPRSTSAGGRPWTGPVGASAEPRRRAAGPSPCPRRASGTSPCRRNSSETSPRPEPERSVSDTPASPSVAVAAPTSDRPTLDVRFVTRMSRRLCEAVSAAARGDGLSSGAWVRRLLTERVGVRFELVARSGRPVHLPREEVAAISDAVRDLALGRAGGTGRVGPCPAAPAASAAAPDRAVISGATRGRGAGDALALHLLKAENEVVTVIPARGLGSADLVAQIRELVAISLGGRTDRPVYHVHLDPDVGIADEAAARARWWSLFEAEFGLEAQSHCGVEHLKHGRRHEHRVYGLVRPSGAMVDLAWDYARREKCGRFVEFEFGMAPVASKHARAIARRLRDEGRAEVAEWLVRSSS